MSISLDSNQTIGKYFVHDGVLIKDNGNIVLQKEKEELLKQLTKKNAQNVIRSDVVNDHREIETQTTFDVAKKKEEISVHGCRGPRIEHIEQVRPMPSSATDDAMRKLIKKQCHSDIDVRLGQDGANSIGRIVRELLRKVILQSKTIASHSCRKRMIPDDIDLAYSLLQFDLQLITPVMAGVPSTDRLYWGRKLVKRPPATCSAEATELGRVNNDRFCESISIRDHWLCIDGVQPCLPENVVPSEIRTNYQQSEADKLLGISSEERKTEKTMEKRLTKQLVSLEHQVFFNEIVNVMTNGTATERQRTLQTIESDRGLQFLVGRFVILIAEGVRMNIGIRNISALAGLMRLSWAIMKNPHVKLERFLHILVPSIVSCVVTRSMIYVPDTVTNFGNRGGNATSSIQGDENEKYWKDIETEYRLRETCSRLLATLCDQFETQRLRLRIVQLLRGVFATKKDPTTIYGALCALFAMGKLTVKTVIIPRLHEIYCSLYADASHREVSTSSMRKQPADVVARRNETAKLRVVELLMKILYEYEACEGPEKERTESSLEQNYSEFGSIFYRYLLATKKFGTNGELLMDKKSLWLTRFQSARGETESSNRNQTSSYSQYSAASVVNSRRGTAVELSEDMLENLLDDSNHPWSEVANRVAGNEASTSDGDIDSKTSTSPTSSSSASLVRQPKLVLIRKIKRDDSNAASESISFLRPLESIPVSVPPSTRPPAGPFSSLHRLDSTIKPAAIGAHRATGGFRSSRAAVSVDDLSVSSQNISNQTKSASESLRKFLARPSPQSAAAVYGRAVEMSERGRSIVDQKIADAAFRLNNVRMRNAVCQRLTGTGTTPSTTGSTTASTSQTRQNRTDVAPGRFLVPTADRGNRL